jgi:hypothetical protein
MFPVMGTILVGFSHAASGRAYAVNILLGMARGCITHSRPFAWCCDRAGVRDGSWVGAGGAGAEQAWVGVEAGLSGRSERQQRRSLNR